MFKSEYKEIKFFYSPLFFALVGGIIYLFWLFDLSAISFAFLFAMLGVVYGTCRDLTPTLIFPFIAPLALYKNALPSYGIYVYAVSGAILVAGVILQFVRFRPFKTIIHTKPRLFTLGVMALFVAIIIGGITVHERHALAQLAITGIVLLLALASIVNSVSMGRDGAERTLNLALTTVVVTSILAALQFATQLIRLDSFSDFIEYKVLPGGVAVNQYANIIARSLPIFFYLSVRKKKWSFLWIIAAMATLGIIAVTNSRATILMAAIFTLGAVVVCMIKSTQKVAWIVTFVAIAGIAVGVVAIKGDLFKKVFNIILERGFSDSERFDVWALGWKRFCLYPIFGTGFDYDLSGIVHDGVSPYYYHNTLVQTIASMGVFGTIAFGFFMFSGVKTVIDAKNVKAYVIGMVVGLIFAISLLDIHFYTPQSLWQIVSIMMCCYAIKGQKKEEPIAEAAPSEEAVAPIADEEADGTQEAQAE